jgi:hypothetical protein
MLAINPAVPIELHADPIDMRKSFDGLLGIVKADPQRDVRNGGLLPMQSHQADVLGYRWYRELDEEAESRIHPLRHLYRSWNWSYFQWNS